MLQFIVLGLVPGTHIQITFGWMLIIFCILAVAITLLAENLLLPPSTQKNSKTTTKKQTKKRTATTA